jgi:hypothetical protein
MMLPDTVTTSRLTDVLRRSGLPGVSVSAVVEESSRPTLLSRITRLRLSYDGEVANAPDTLILKTGLGTDVGSGFRSGEREVAFYTQIAPRCSIAPRCFEAYCDSDAQKWHLLLQDLTDTHLIATVWPLPPTRQQCERIVEAHARFHAVWWDDQSITTERSASYRQERLHDLQRAFAQFTDRFGDQLSDARRSFYERLLSAMPRLFERYSANRHLTIVQGDAHVWNCFLPRDGSDDVRIFDWDAWHTDFGATDLAYMMATHWYPERRKQLEPALLDRYHATLLAHGVQGYDRSALDHDYRLGVLIRLMSPIRFAAANIPPVVWWNNMERLLLAADDLDCHELLC